LARCFELTHPRLRRSSRRRNRHWRLWQ
jgi:hypothetical protein